MDIFVYGTLTNPSKVAAVVDSYAFVGPAILDGLHPVEGEFPTLAPGGDIGGRILRTNELDALDAYEGVERGLYVRVSVPWADRPEGAVDDTVEIYVGDADRLGVEEPVEWPDGDGLRSRVERYVADHGVAIRPVDEP